MRADQRSLIKSAEDQGNQIPNLSIGFRKDFQVEVETQYQAWYESLEDTSREAVEDTAGTFHDGQSKIAGIYHQLLSAEDMGGKAWPWPNRIATLGVPLPQS